MTIRNTCTEEDVFGIKYPKPGIPTIYLVVGPYALWMTTDPYDAETDNWDEGTNGAMSDLTTKYWSANMSVSTNMPDMDTAVQIEDIVNWEGTCWYSPENNYFEPSGTQMYEIKRAIRQFTRMSLKWDKRD